MIVSETLINPIIARQILQEAEQNGVAVEDYLKEIAKKSSSNGNKKLPKVRQTDTKLDFSQEEEWLKENRKKFIGKWIVLDGKRLVGFGENPVEIFNKAKEEGVKIPFVQFITDDSKPFWGGWV